MSQAKDNYYKYLNDMKQIFKEGFRDEITDYVVELEQKIKENEQAYIAGGHEIGLLFLQEQSKVNQLEAEKAELIEIIKSYYYILSSGDTIDFNNDCDFQESKRIFNLLKKHGVEI